MISVAMAGLKSGSTMLKNVRYIELPSTRAASSSSTGTWT